MTTASQNILFLTSIRLFVAAFGIVLTACEGSEIVAEIDVSATDSSGTDDADESDDANDTSRGSDPDDNGDTVSEGDDTDGIDCGNVVAIGRETFFIDNEYDLAALEGVEQVRGSLIIGNFDSDRVDMSTLASLRCVEGDMAVYAIENLESLDVFFNLRRVKYDLAIGYNDQLENIDALKNLKKLGGNELFIFDNPSLPTCAAREIWEGLLDSGWSGRTCINYNLSDSCRDITSGCGSQSVEIYW